MGNAPGEDCEPGEGDAPGVGKGVGGGSTAALSSTAPVWGGRKRANASAPGGAGYGRSPAETFAGDAAR